MTTRPGVGERVHAPEQVVGFLLRERGVGLVEQEHAGVLGQGPRDLRALLHGQRHELQGRSATSRMPSSSMSVRSTGVEIAPQPLRVPSRPIITFSPTVRLGNSCGSWCTTATRCTPMSTDQGSPSTMISPAVCGGLAGEDLDQRALAGAVGTRDAQDLAGSRLEVQAIERDACRRSACAGRG